MASDSGYKPIPDSEAFGPVPTQTPAAKPKSRGRRFGVAAALTFLVLLLFRDPLVHCCQQISEHVNHKHKTVEQRAHHVLSRHPLIDGHIDLPIALRFSVGNRIDNAEFTKSFAEGGLMGHVDLHRLRKGLSGGAFWSVFAPCPEDGSDFSDGNYAASVQYTLDQIDVMKRLQSAFPHDFSKSYESAAALSDFHRHGKLISPLGVEGLHQIANSAANLRRFHDLGVRYATLTHNCHNKFADAAIVGEPPRKSEPHWGGVSPIGRQLVHEMNRIGMIIDLSHVSEDTMVDVLGGKEGWSGSRAPIIFSHSSAWSVCNHPRNVKDHVLKLVKERNSVVMVNVAPAFISCINEETDSGIPVYDPKGNNLDQVVKHIMHIGNLIGWDYVGIGTDFDGIFETPTGFEDVSKYPDLIAALLKEGVSDADAAKLVGGNVLRVWSEVEAVSARMQAEGAPAMEDERKETM